MDPTLHDPNALEATVGQLFEPAQAAYRAGRLAPDRSEAVWAAIQADLAGDAARRPALPVSWLAAAAALLIGVGGTLLLTRGGAGPSVTRPTPPAPAAPVVAESVQAPITLPSEARIEPIGGPVEVLEASPHRTRLAVRRAAVRSTVPPLAKDAGAYYLVQTPLAEVSVLGTVFTVKDGDDGATTVSVTEGRVQVSPHDGRPPQILLPGETAILEPLTAQGAERARARDDWAQAGWIWRTLALRLSEPLAQENELLRVGRKLADAPPAVQISHWQAAVARHTNGAHAEEYFFRLGDALRRAGQLARARGIGAAFRRRFPQSSRVQQTKEW